MRKVAKLFFSQYLFIFCIFFLSLISINSSVIDITDTITGNSDYKKASFASDGRSEDFFFKYSVENIPTSRVGAFRFDFDTFDPSYIDKFNVYCTFVDGATSDEDLESRLGNINDQSSSSCLGAFKDTGIYDGIIEYHESYKKLGIRLQLKESLKFTSTVYIRTKETLLEVKEAEFTADETYSLIPFTVIIENFRNNASKILFYSYTRELQMYYVEQSTLYPKKLFSGNVMSVYTNPNMVHQKYNDAKIMILLTRDFSQLEVISEQFKFQVKFFPSNYLLDYYVSNNPEGRSKNTPLSINMTECDNPYYVVLNYNKPEKQTSLYIDQIYGKIKSLSVATKFTKLKWEEMLENDMNSIQYNSRKYVFPKESSIHMDVYRVECEIPLLLNFYYVDESASIPELDFGNVAIATLKANKMVCLPFASGIYSPQLTIEVFNPIKLPYVIVNDGQNEFIMDTNQLIKTTPFNAQNITIKERGGDSDTRIIIKVGYTVENWGDHSDYVKYNEKYNMYVFSFPSDESKLNYTFADLVTSGIGDNIKYCYATNIGSAIVPSSENCYRVSSFNSYNLKVLNPFIIHKDYNLNEELIYYVSLKPVVSTDKLEISAILHTYGTEKRNIEGIGNTIQLDTTGEYNTILTAPKNKDANIFVQICQCKKEDIEMEILNAYTYEKVVSETTIPSGNRTFFSLFPNVLMETELHIRGSSQSNVFVKHTGLRSGYNLGVKPAQKIDFNSELNQLIVECPIYNYERMKYTVLIGKSGELSGKGITLCSFTEGKSLSNYNKTVESYYELVTITINFIKAGLKSGETFEALVYSEQQLNSKMVFLSDIYTGTVGEIKEESIIEINKEENEEYVYAEDTASSSKLTHYFSYLPNNTFDVPIGALRIVLESDSTNGLSGIDMAFVDDGEDPVSMVEAVEEVIDSRNPYYKGGRSTTNARYYNYIFRYSYTSDKKPRRLVIKISNGYFMEGKFRVYIRKGESTYLEQTDFEEEKEYGKEEENKNSVLPYIVDLARIRGGNSSDYVSKLLIYSQHLEMQMYYIDESEETNAPILLFTGNIMLVLTKLDLAIQKYHSTKLILLSENLNGQEHSSIGSQYRFHTKMYKSDAQIEYFVSNNPTGRTLNYPLSVEMNTCTDSNNKYYYILNYNKAEEERILYLDMVFGSMKRARIANEINAQKWDDLIENSMTEISNYQISLASRSQHIDVLEIECNTPLLANVYYNYEDYTFANLELGDIAVKTLNSSSSMSITFDDSLSGFFYYSISAFNPIENPNMIFKFSNGLTEQIQENVLKSSFLLSVPESVSIINNGNTPTRFILKIGYGVESQWIDEQENIEGILYSKDNKYVYKFPFSDSKKNFTNVTIDVKPMKKGSEEEAENVKFCYSTSIGMAIDVSLENCFRTGANIHYSLTFINPLIMPKMYKTLSDYYYVTLSPYSLSDSISLDITEGKYETIERNNEAIGNIVKLENETKSTILSLPEIITNTQILIQLQLCGAESTNQINYNIYNAYTHQDMGSSTLVKTKKFSSQYITNNLMETELEFVGNAGDSVFIKHIGITNYKINIKENYVATFDESQNIVIIEKPILNEAFNFTVLVGTKGRFDSYSLCTFTEIPKSKYSELGNYVKTFTSVSSDIITHYIDFHSANLKVGDEFDLLVYAEQLYNSKIELLYEVISGKVGEIKGVEQIIGTIPNKNNYVTQLFKKNLTSNYLFYNFPRVPEGNIASLKIKQESLGDEGMRVNKVGCVFVSLSFTDEEMVTAVNKAMIDGTNVCTGETQKDTNGYDALVNARNAESLKRLVIQVIYGFGEDNEKNNNLKDDDMVLNITMRINGFKVDTQDFGYNEDEDLTIMPYYLKLDEIRKSNTEEYVSKVLLFSNTRELQMFYLDTSGAPVELFSGNIMLVYTNPEVINEKYHGATTMILVTDSLSATQRVILGEQFRFKVNFFDSPTTIQYYVSANPLGRLLNNPTSIEMISCDQPYYYILNYNQLEGDRILHIDNIFGEINSIKIANELNDNNWFDFVSNMEQFEGSDYYIVGQEKYHIDVLEVTCKIPLLLNVYYTDPVATKKTNLDQGDISIITLAPGTRETLTFKLGLVGEFIYSFNVLRGYGKDPNILVEFDDDELIMKKNGIFTKQSTENYFLINLYNKQLSGEDTTKIIFKFGYNVEKTFTKIENDIYNLQTKDRPANLFAYIFKNGEDRLNYTKVNFTVSTTSPNVKFCYTSNLGSFIDPSLQNCYRVGSTNPYTITILNPYVMYKNYYTSEKYLDYYVSFRTEDINLNVTIKPTLFKYSTDNRNLENIPKVLTMISKESTILTAPSNFENLVFVSMYVCSPDRALTYKFNNAYNSSSLNQEGEIPANLLLLYQNVPNTKLDLELSLEDSKPGQSKILIKHVGMNERYQPITKDFSITFDSKKNILEYSQPIEGEEFTYKIFIDKEGYLQSQSITLCSVFEIEKLSHYTVVINNTKEEKINITLDFTKDNLVDYEDFDVLIFAEQIEKGKLLFLSDVKTYHSKNKEDEDGDSNTVLVVVLVVLAVILVGGGIFLFICLRNLKNKPMENAIIAKPTNLDDIQGTNKGEKMIDSMAQSQAYETQQ